ncbi:PfkB family carbohydrate kinase [Phenylobacterium sp.]|uniref:carbohydrate kinase family protein n=1 Tax=Phenylobacterium sp. TaxID=1871053 RepID=UPI00286C761B|nr:PfkB family carbohydrate kinase [Phenylobacterium sp.]
MEDLVVIGALALDRPVRLSGPPLPGARLSGHSLGGVLAGRLGGGGANAGVALTRAGHKVRLISVIAEDADADVALGQARSAGLGTALVVRRPGFSRTTLILIDPAGERLVLGLDMGLVPPSPIPPPSADVGFQGLYVRAAYPGAETWAQACLGPVVAHWPCGGFAGPCDVLIASADDCDEAVRAAPFAAGRAQVGERLAWMVMTHGAGEVVAHGPNDQIRVLPSPAKVVDATGAGDTFAAGLLDALVAGAGIEAALSAACAWGAIAVGLDSSAPLAGDFPAFRPGSP